MNGTLELVIDLPRFEDVDVEYERLVASRAVAVYAPKTEAWGMRSGIRAGRIIGYPFPADLLNY